MKANTPAAWIYYALYLLALLCLLAACAPFANLPVAPTSVSVITEAAQPTQPVEPPAVSPDITVTLAPLAADPQQAALVQFILTDLAGTEKQHLLVAQVNPTPNDLRSILKISTENILAAWRYQDGILHDFTASDYMHSYIAEPNGPWKYSYMAFSLNEVNPDVSTAVVRIDRMPGLAGGKGQLFELVRVGDLWTVKSSRITWIQ